MKPVPPSFVTTRQSLHAIAEHVMSAAQHASIGKIGLRSSRHPGFETQEFDGRVLRIDRATLRDDNRSMQLDGACLRAIGAFVGIEPGAPEVYEPATPLEFDAPLTVNADDSFHLGAWFFLVNGVLRKLTETPIQIWPEHFDIACDFNETNYGASAGDDTYPEPYAYVGPWDRSDTITFDDPWGWTLHYAAMRDVDDPHQTLLDFFKGHLR